MLTRVLLICLVVALVKANTKFSLNEYQSKNLMTEFNQQTDVSLKIQALRVQRYLSSLPAQCGLTHWATVQDAEVAALASFYRCKTKVILENIGKIAVDTGEFALSIYAYGSNMVAEVLACINPRNWIFCILSAPKQIANDVKGIIIEVNAFYNQAKTLIPNIVKEIRNCLHKSSSDYQQLLDGIFQVAKSCNEHFDH